MGAYSLDKLIRKWGRGELTVEQTIGQILLHVQALQSSVASLERRFHLSTGSGQTRQQPEDRDGETDDEVSAE